MKVLLINPRTNTSRAESYYMFPLGLLAAASSLESENVEVKFYDLGIVSLSIQSIIKKENPDAVCITCYTFERFLVFNICKQIKSINSNIITILGGYHPSFLYKQILENYLVDIVIIGEGEKTLPSLIKVLKNKKEIKRVKGIAFLKSGKVIKTCSQDTIKADEVRLPPYYLVKDQLNRSSYKRWILPLVMSSRGCLNDCIFCRSYIEKGLKIFNFNQVLEEIDYFVDNFQIKSMAFGDGSFNFDKIRAGKLCNLISKRGYNLDFRATLRVDNVDNHLLRCLKKAGFLEVWYGVESGNQKILDNVNKNTKINHIVSAFRKTRKAGINPSAFVQLGLPEEDKNSLKETERLVKKIDPYNLMVVPSMIIPGTQLYESSKSQGKIKEEDWLRKNSTILYTDNPHLFKLKCKSFKMELQNAFKHNHKRMLINTIIKRLLRRTNFCNGPCYM